MLSLQEIVDFLEIDEELIDREIVEIIVYFLTELHEQGSSTTSEVRKQFHTINHPVPSRTAQYLSEGTRKNRQQYVKKGNGYALHRRNAKRLGEKLEDLSGSIKPEIRHEILEVSSCAGGRKYLVSLVNQINGTYTYGFYDATAVLMRRFMESLIISAFQNKSLDHKIIDPDGNYLMLGALINQAKNPSNFKLSRGMGEILDAIKDLGDTAAHNRSYITKKTDLDNVLSRFRRLIEELCTLSGV